MPAKRHRQKPDTMNPFTMLKDKLGVIIAIGAAAAVVGYAYRVPFRLETVEKDVSTLKSDLKDNNARLAAIEKGQDLLSRDLQTDRATFGKVAASLDNMLNAWNDHLRSDVKRDMRVEGLESLNAKLGQLGADLARESIANNEFKLSIERDIARLQKNGNPKQQDEP